jgi:hypothetical protein
MMAIAYAGLGDRAAVLSQLEAAVRRHDDLVSDVGVDPVFASYWREPRVLALLKDMGLPETAGSPPGRQSRHGPAAT